MVIAATAAAVGVDAGPANARRDVIIALLALGMGLRNATVRRLGVPDLTTTVLTMTITGLSADRPRGEGREAATSRRAGSILAMLVGALAGAALVVRGHMLLTLILLSAVLLLIAAAYAGTIRRPRSSGPRERGEVGQRTRGMGFYLIAFQGGMAAGSVAAGVAAQALGLSATFALASAGLLLGPLAALRYRFQPITPDDLLPAGDWPQPHLSGDEAPGGPVMVTVEYRPRPGLEDEFLAELSAARYARRRTGASAWKVWRDAEQPDRFVEQFVVASWPEHLRQHERVTRRDQARFERVRALTDPDRPTAVTHWATPQLHGPS